MDRTVVIETDADRTALIEIIGDLSTYPDWMGLVHRVIPAVSRGSDLGPAYEVDLRASIGPLARSKRLRMVRTEYEPARRVVYRREEADDREHSQWVLTVDAVDPGLHLRLDYDGRLWIPVLDAVLERRIERDRPRLLALVAERSS
jgi:hypothetical protein